MKFDGQKVYDGVVDVAPHRGERGLKWVCDIKDGIMAKSLPIVGSVD